MFTRSAAYAVPLPSPFNRPTDRPAEVNQYVIQLTIPSSSSDSGNSPNGDTRKQGRANGSVIVWAGVGRVKPPPQANGSDGLNEYERTLAEEMGDAPTQVEATFEGSRKLGQDFACAIPTTIKGAPVASSTLMNGVEAQEAGSGVRSGRARGMAERLAQRFQTQLLLSIDVPPATHLLTTMDSGAGMAGGVPGMDPLGDKLYLGLEKALVRVLEKALA